MKHTPLLFGYPWSTASCYRVHGTPCVLGCAEPRDTQGGIKPAPWCQKGSAYDSLGLLGLGTLQRLGVLKLEEGWQAGGELEPCVISPAYPSLIIYHDLTPTTQNPDCSAG